MLRLFFIIILAIIINLPGCAGNFSKNSISPVLKPYQSVPADEADLLIKSDKEKGGLKIIDVRTPDEYSEGHIENSVNINYNNPDFKAKISELNRNDTYLIYCRSGRRSGEALETFKELGFKKVYNLSKGFDSWLSEGLPSVK